mgnify:CR=1 FL=1
MLKLDKNEKIIVRELIRNPRISDNRLSKRTGIPVMTVNRKRKKLEQGGRLFYYTRFATGEEEFKEYTARALYIIKFKIGITKKQYLRTFQEETKREEFYSEHLVSAWLGEKDGHLALIMIVEAETETQLVECFNGKIVPNLKLRFGDDCIRELITTKIISVLREHHTYLPLINMSNGRLKDDWLDDWIYVLREPRIQ